MNTAFNFINGKTSKISISNVIFGDFIDVLHRDKFFSTNILKTIDFKVILLYNIY